MQLIRGIYNIKKQHKKCIATIGNFDGVHLGHQKIIQQMREEASKLNLNSCVILFEPHPKEFFSKHKSPKRIFSLVEKLIMLNHYKVDQVLCLQFNHHFQKITADKFIKNILVDKLNITSVYIGSDFKYGKNREGDWIHLSKCAKKLNFNLKRCEKLLYGDKHISSTLIRELLKSNNIKLATKLLGHDFTINGKVVHGNKYGRKLGFPTANINLGKYNYAINGVFAVFVYLDNFRFFGVANIGKKPDQCSNNNLLEVHFLDFNGNLYGKRIRVQFVEKLRDTQKFSSMELLANRIKQDIQLAKTIFNLKDNVF